MKLEITEEQLFEAFTKRLKAEYNYIINGLELNEYIEYYGDALSAGGSLTRFIKDMFKLDFDEEEKYYEFYRYLAAEVFENNNLEVLKDESTK